MHCQACGKKTTVRQTCLHPNEQTKRLRVCSDDTCEALPFWTWEKRAKGKKGTGGDDEKSST